MDYETPVTSSFSGLLHRLTSRDISEVTAMSPKNIHATALTSVEKTTSLPTIVLFCTALQARAKRALHETVI